VSKKLHFATLVLRLCAVAEVLDPGPSPEHIFDCLGSEACLQAESESLAACLLAESESSVACLLKESES